MNNLQSLLEHPAVKGSSQLVIKSEEPVIVNKGGDEQKLGKPLSTDNIIKLLKASLPEDVLSELTPSSTTKHLLQIGTVEYDLNIAVSPDEIYLVTVAPSMDSPTQVAETPKVEEATYEEPVDPEIIDALIEGDSNGLIYYQDGKFLGDLENLLEQYDLSPKKSDLGRAITEVLNYHHYPIVFFQLGEDFRSDQTYIEMTQMKMKERRQKFIALVAPGLESGNPMLAFSLSVNLVLDSSDLSDANKQLEKAYNTWKRHVGTYHQFLEQEGKL